LIPHLLVGICTGLSLWIEVRVRVRVRVRVSVRVRLGLYENCATKGTAQISLLHCGLLMCGVQWTTCRQRSLSIEESSVFFNDAS